MCIYIYKYIYTYKNIYILIYIPLHAYIYLYILIHRYIPIHSIFILDFSHVIPFQIEARMLKIHFAIKISRMFLK